jgi:N-glycosylase/DNA lyase
LNARRTHHFAVADYDLAATLSCGQAFRWRPHPDGWQSVIGDRWVRLRQSADGIMAETLQAQTDWCWLAEYLQTEIDFSQILAAFPADDPHLQAGVRAHRGLRLLRQPPWECLASFILSSTKQIVQIRQIIELLCQRYGEPVSAPPGIAARAFPTAERLTSVSEAELRESKMGFRAKYLRAAASAVASGALDLEQLCNLPHAEARERLMSVPGVGEKIADCVALFGYGFADAFPIDVWVARALRQYYFRGRNIPLPRLRMFAEKRWQGCGGYAQQYLFHHIRQSAGKIADRAREPG